MRGFHGADVAELRQLASKMLSAGQKLEGQRQTFGARIAATSWPGPDGDRFRQDWRADHSRTLGAAALFLKQAAEELVRQANEQETASSGSGSSIGRGGLAGVQASVPGSSDVRGKSAAEVRTWWLGLTASQQKAFVRNHPDVAGNTNGIPFSVRTEANRANAQSRIDWLTNQDPEPAFNPWRAVDSGYPARYAAEHEAWRNRQSGLDYLRRVVAGEVQLAAYDPGNNSIVEMKGTYGPDTSTVITYVPGTTTNETSFYGNGPQAVADYLVGSDPTGTVAFVYKGTEFPDGDFAEAFLVEAKSDEFVAATAPVLRDFQAAVDLEKPAGAQTVGIGHSWGLRNVTGSEVAGAHYDKVMALSGAAMTPGWRADPDTKYFSYTYPDILQTAELSGVVGDNYPMKESVFEKHVYAPQGGADWTDAYSIGNHSLIATTDQENEVALEDLRRDVYARQP